MRTFLLKYLNTFTTPSVSLNSSPPTLVYRLLISILPEKVKIECHVMVTC